MVFQPQQVQFTKTTVMWLLMTLLLPVAGFWRVWSWYLNRTSGGMEEAVAMVAVLAFLSLVAIKLCWQRRTYFQFSLWPMVILLTIYGLSYLWPLPPMLRATLAFTAVSVTIYALAFGQRPPSAFWPLILIALPVVPSLQFYLGFPARYFSASLTVPLLQMNGLAVSQSGTYLLWQDQLIQFDAPCSGVTMLWAGWLLTLFIGFNYRFTCLKTTLALSVALILVLSGNVLRASSLFYIESGLFKLDPAWSASAIHEGIGISAFLLVAIAIMSALTKINRGFGIEITGFNHE